MTDSLGRLVLRAQGRLPVAAPLLRSRYADEGRADVGWGEEIGETTAPVVERTTPVPPAPVAPAPVARGRAFEVSAPTASDVPIPAMASMPAPAAPIPTRHDRQPVPPLAELPLTESPAMVAPAIADAARAQHFPTAASAATGVQREAAPPDRPPANPAPQQGMGHIAPAAAAAQTEHARAPIQPTFAQQLGPAPPPRRSTAPEVRISIGRVEVHAAAPVPAMAPLPPRSAPARRPAVSLADYLAERGRAR